MHCIFYILEIADLICSHLQYRGVQMHLATLARTSRIFQGPALDILWRTQTNLVNLTRCMPPDIWEQEWLLKPLTENDWERVMFYASYPALESLAVQSNSNNSKLRQHCISIHLQSFTAIADFEFEGTAARLASLSSALGNHCSPASLVQLKIGNTSAIEPDTGEMVHYAIMGNQLQPLFQFSNLTEVDLEAPSGFTIDDITADNMARAWPRIEHLHLAAGTDTQYPPNMTLHGLLAFARHCAALSSLSIVINANNVPPSDFAANIRVLQTKLTTLNVGQSPISKPKDVARFLSAIFSSIERIWSDGAAVRNRWEEVQNLLPMIYPVREEERVWAKQSIGMNA
ncbi:hypothetical protein B0H10DRAFT_2354569 [Mycena sp. CBHHK59/15]|nr:hypothetical protein B0H10DRAFT_2354569 [Mycena sp. CBHHK59/15]